jgi:hypothetical protein
VTRRVLLSLAAVFFVPALAYADPAEPSSQQGTTAPSENAPPKVPKEMAERTDFSLSLTTLDALRKKGALTEEEYNAALRDLISVGMRAKGAPTFVLGRFVTTFYGWLQGDFIHDSQRIVTDQWGGHPTLQLPNAPLPANTVAGAATNGRTVFGARGTRLGFRLSAPAIDGTRVSGNVEFDFLGNQPAITGVVPRQPQAVNNPNITESGFFVNATPRIRQAFVKIDTPVVSVWVGQTWSLIGFEAAFFPTSVQYQGLPGQLFSRNPQLRLSRVVDAGAASVEVAAAVQRPPQLDSEIPDFQGGLKLNFTDWTGVQTLGATGTTVSPASIAVSGALRRFKFARTISADPAFGFATGKIIAADAFIPIIPVKARGPLSVAVIGEATTGEGASDLFTGLTGGAQIGQPTPLNAQTANVAAIQDGDNGPVGWVGNSLQTVNWRTLLVGLEIHTGPLVLAGNYSNVYSNNVQSFTGANWNRNMWWNACALVDVGSGFRFGAEFARTLQRKTAVGHPLANESRVFVSGFFIF